MPDEKKPAAGGDLEAAYQAAMSALDGTYQNTVEKESKKEPKKGQGK